MELEPATVPGTKFCSTGVHSGSSRDACGLWGATVAPLRAGGFRNREGLMNKLLFTPSEAAAVLGVGRSKVYELLRNFQLPSVRIDRCRRIPADELVALVERLRSAGTFGSPTKPAA